MHPDMAWRVADATDMTAAFCDSQFDIVLEKATVDAFVANERSQWEVSDAAADTVHKALKVWTGDNVQLTLCIGKSTNLN